MRKLLSRAVALSILASATCMSASYADAIGATTLPSFDSANSLNKNVTVTTPSAAKMQIQVTGGQGAIGEAHWNSFNIGKDAHVNVDFTNTHQTSLNYVNATGGMSQINGLFTDSGCNNCGYEGSGKVLLINPNGIVFGSGANVNLNSFTASTFNNTSFNNKYSNGTLSGSEVKFTDDGRTTTSAGIKVEGGAKIYGDKAVVFATNKFDQDPNSKIGTNASANYRTSGIAVTDLTFSGVNGKGGAGTANNYNNGTESVGKVKIVTSDGVNFSYYNNQGINQVSGIKKASAPMTLQLNGDITAGHIEAINSSEGGNININQGTLKAIKAAKGSDGNIWLTAEYGNITTDGAKLYSYQQDDPAADLNVTTPTWMKGTVDIYAKNVSLANSDIQAMEAVNIEATENNAVIDKTKVLANTNVKILADKGSASIQNGSDVFTNKGKITLKGAQNAIVSNSEVSNNSTSNNTNDIDIIAGTGYANIANSNVVAGGDVNISSAKVLDSENFNGIQINNDSSKIIQGNNVNLTASNSNITSNELNSSIISARNGNVTLKSEKNAIVLNDLAQFKPTNGKVNLVAPNATNGKVQIVKNGSLDMTNYNVDITAGNDVTIQAQGTNSDLTIGSSTNFNSVGGTIYLKGGQDVLTKDFGTTSAQTLDTKGIKTNIDAGRNIKVKLANVDQPTKGLVATAQNDVDIRTNGKLSVSVLVADKGNMNLEAQDIIAGADKNVIVTDPRTGLDSSDTTPRSYIKVGGEKFTTSVETQWEKSGSPVTKDGKTYNTVHHIKYGTEQAPEKIYLVYNKLTEKKVYDDPTVAPADPASDKGIVSPVTKKGDTVKPTPVNPDPTPIGGGTEGGTQGGGGTEGGDGTTKLPCDTTIYDAMGGESGPHRATID